MAVTYQLSKADLREAVAADLAWTALDAKADYLSSWFGKVGFWVIGGVVGIAAFVVDSPKWQVSAWTLLTVTLWSPCVLLIVAVQALLRSRRRTRTFSGIREAPAPQPGLGARRLMISVIAWLILVLIAAGIGYYEIFRAPIGMAALPTTSDAAGAATWAVPSTALLGWSFLPLFAGTALLAMAQKRMRFAYTERASFTAYEPRTLQIDDEGITVFDAHGHIRTKWSGFRQFMETEHLILVYPADQSFHAFPKRSLQATGELEVLLMLLRERVPRGVVQRRPPGGFPVQMTAAMRGSTGEEGNLT